VLQVKRTTSYSSPLLVGSWSCHCAGFNESSASALDFFKPRY